MLEEARSEPRSRELSQCDAGGIRDGTTDKEPAVGRRKTLADEATRRRGPRGEYTQQQGKIQRSERAKPTAGKTRANPTAGKTRAKPTEGEKSIEDMEDDWKESKSDTLQEIVAKSKAETTPKSEPKATTKPKAGPTAETRAKAKADATAKSTPKPFRVDRTGVDREYSNGVASRKQMRRER